MYLNFTQKQKYDLTTLSYLNYFKLQVLKWLNPVINSLRGYATKALCVTISGYNLY